MTIFISESRTIKKHEREPLRATEKHIEEVLKWITDRDIQVLKELLKHPFLTVEQIEMMVFNNIKPSNWRTQANLRLRRLYHAHCIDRFFPPTEKDAGSSQQVCLLDYVGAKILAKVHNRTKFKWRKRNYVPQDYRHILKVNDFKSLLHVLNRQIGVIDGHAVGRIHTWNSEKVIKFHYSDNGRIKDAKIRPDAFGIYIYTARGNAKFFFLECDNATEPMQTIFDKMVNYKRFYESGQWRETDWGRKYRVFPSNLFIFHHQEQVDEFVAYSKRLNSNGTRFLATTYNQLYNDTVKKYENSHGKHRLVLQERKVKVLDEIWSSKDGLVTL